MKQLNMKTAFAAMVAVFAAVGFTGCNDDDNRYNDDYILLGLNPALKVLAGGECNSSFTLSGTEQTDTTFTVDMSLYQNRVADMDATVDLVVAEDTLTRAVALAQDEANGAKYTKFKDARLLPASFYLLSGDRLTLEAGEVVSGSVTLAIHRDQLVADPLRKDRDVLYVLPLQIRNSSSYAINDAVDTWMLMITVPMLQGTGDAGDPGEGDGGAEEGGGEDTGAGE